MKSSQVVWKQLPSLPDLEGFASAFAGVSHDALLVAGGANFPEKRPWDGGTKVWSDKIFMLASTGEKWREVSPLPHAIAYGVSVSLPDGIVCAGGGNATEHFRDTFLLTWDGQKAQIKPLPSLPSASAFGSGAAVGHTAYLFGGIARPDAIEASAELYALDLSEPAPAWKKLPSCPGLGRMLAQVGVVGETLYVCGGVSLGPGLDGKPIRAYLSDTYAYDSQRGWRKCAAMPHGVAAAPSPMPVSKQGNLYVISGDDGSRVQLIGPNHPGFLQEIFFYNPSRDDWTKIADAPISRATAPTTRWRDAWIIASGERKPGYRSPEMWTVQFEP